MRLRVAVISTGPALEIKLCHDECRKLFVLGKAPTPSNLSANSLSLCLATTKIVPSKEGFLSYLHQNGYLMVNYISSFRHRIPHKFSYSVLGVMICKTCLHIRLCHHHDEHQAECMNHLYLLFACLLYKQFFFCTFDSYHRNTSLYL